MSDDTIVTAKTKAQAITLGKSVLFCARLGDAAQLKRYIEHRADVNVQDDAGMTALHHAAAKASRPCIRVLVASGKCDYLLRDNEDRYAYQLAYEWGKDYALGRLLAKKQRQQALRQGVAAWSKPD